MVKPSDGWGYLSVCCCPAAHCSPQPRETEDEGPSTEEFGSTIVDFRTHQVLVDGNPVKVTQLELRLLRYFLENEDRVIPRSELLENVWDMPGNVTTRAVDQFIARLRKLFETDPSAPEHILTIRDAGYRFVR